MSQIIRNAPYSIIGLTKGDLNHRIIIVNGYVRRELLPPYRYFSERDIKTITDYLNNVKDKSRIYTDYSGCPLKYIHKIFEKKIPKVAEQVGGCLEICVDTNIHFFLEAGSNVLIQLDMIISEYPNLSNFHKGKRLLQNHLSRFPERRVIIHGDEFLFFKQ